MFRGIVLGEFWGISEGVWVQLWSGTLGAVVSAGVAAWVAVSVLKRSNRTQQDLVVLQLREQRREASEVREKAAVADTIAAAMGLAPACRESRDAVHRETALLRSALVRWRLELGSSKLGAELQRWESTLLGAATNHWVELTKGEIGDSDKSFAILSNLTATIAAVGLNWQTADDPSRDRLLSVAQRAREAASTELREMTGLDLRL